MVDLDFLADNMLGMRPDPIRVWGPESVPLMVQEHLLNNQVRADFARLPRVERPVLQH